MEPRGGYCRGRGRWVTRLRREFSSGEEDVERRRESKLGEGGRKREKGKCKRNNYVHGDAGVGGGGGEGKIEGSDDKEEEERMMGLWWEKADDLCLFLWVPGRSMGWRIRWEEDGRRWEKVGMAFVTMRNPRGKCEVGNESNVH